MPEQNPSVVTTRDGAVARITLNRPDRLNAITIPMMQRLRAALEEAQDEQIRCVLLAANGRGFCAGQDLTVLARQHDHHAPGDIGKILTDAYNPVIAAIRDLAKPVIGLIQGVAAGAGWAIALACDLRLAGRSARFVPAFAQLGLVPDMGGTDALVEAVGYARAIEFLLLEDAVSAEEARTLGLVNAVVDDAELNAAGDAWARRIAALPPAGVAQTKRLLRASAGHSGAAALRAEAWAQAVAASDPGHRAALDAWRQRRA
ncbi:MAG TPA: enoyl-CoA hydratase-related protein [Phycisphaerae bacterium]|nr:enoyl-CoA hydratase-related protein [Phycisphaerae bacterium]